MKFMLVRIFKKKFFWNNGCDKISDSKKDFYFGLFEERDKKKSEWRYRYFIETVIWPYFTARKIVFYLS